MKECIVDPKNPFTQAQGLIGNALTLLDAANDLPPALVVRAGDTLHIMLLTFGVWSRRPRAVLSNFEWNLISDDFAELVGDALVGDQCAAIRALIEQARRVVGGAVAVPLSRDEGREFGRAEVGR